MFEGDRAGAEAFLRSIAGNYYVYVLCRPDGEPFYVGKGVNKRAVEHEAEARRHHPFGESNPFKCNVIRKIIRDGQAVRYRIDSVHSPAEQQACLAREAELIRQYGRLHEQGCLTNLAGGLGNFAGAAPFSVERHAATLSGEPSRNPERVVLNRFLQVGSVPVKPLSQIARILPTTPHPSPRSPTLRCAYALVASASAAARQLSPGVRLPRLFHYGGVAGIIENGVARDLLKAGMASLVTAADPREEQFELNEAQIGFLERLMGPDTLRARGIA